MAWRDDSSGDGLPVKTPCYGPKKRRRCTLKQFLQRLLSLLITGLDVPPDRRTACH
jgi:hypothetical protein